VSVLLQELDKARDAATKEAEAIFQVDFLETVLDRLGEAHRLDKASGNKSEQVESYQVQFVSKKLQECRQAFTRTKGRNHQLRKYLPWYRVLFACYRRIKYASLNVYQDV
jgi:hypothetical protein